MSPHDDYTDRAGRGDPAGEPPYGVPSAVPCDAPSGFTPATTRTKGADVTTDRDEQLLRRIHQRIEEAAEQNAALDEGVNEYLNGRTVIRATANVDAAGELNLTLVLNDGTLIETTDPHVTGPLADLLRMGGYQQQEPDK